MKNLYFFRPWEQFVICSCQLSKCTEYMLRKLEGLHLTLRSYLLNCYIRISTIIKGKDWVD